ncbi:spore coat protein U domain-containing protein [Brevundimonas goettingensis]|uniref:Spore coat protein U domain-containing protein n=1 Tax=Brevundimonas goettingensis TaxID=2774190 RepID=A0A975C619_9CAUL|nr:spore coat protein U domain-containing protein [Brevundimonas goettingensis]QTC92242.1 spore coat protein U domain-containing protein [Brevundimonas goettingensis]
MRALIIVTVLLTLPTVPAAAQSGACRISVTGLTFAPYRSLNASPTTNIGRLEVFCLPGEGSAAVPVVTLSAGRSGNYVDRTMTAGSSELHYNLYAEPTRRLVLGDGTAGTVAFPAPRTRTIGRASWPIFGVIPPGQRVPAGSYSDTLLIEVAF